MEKVNEMKFNIEGTRTRTITTTIVEKVEGEIDITKKNVMEATECLAKEDGDSTAWYGYVDEAIYNDSPLKETDLKTESLSETKVETIDWNKPMVDW
tara:strand:- start:626 stop:916 length:291 start_codon:yes stop_codon:yes gene_type:complete